MSTATTPNPQNDVPEAVAAYISQAEKHLSDQTNRQFRLLATVTLLPVIILVVSLGILPRLTRTTTGSELFQVLEQSNQQLSAVAQTLLQSSRTVTATNTALQAVLTQADLHRQAIDQLKQVASQPSAETQSLIQVVGTAAILALLGALGLQRLQNIDTEINNVRVSVFEQAEARAQAIKENLQSQIDDEVQSQFEKTRESIQKFTDDSRQRAVDELAKFTAQIQGVNAEITEIKALLDKYPWLTSKDQFSQASRIQRLTSVDQAQELSEGFRRANDEVSAGEALRAIVTRKLPGDCADFHNAHSEAMRLKDVQLGLDIVELGLQYFPDQYDLVADKTKALASLGRVVEARDYLESWRQRKPEEFTRSWRPVVFYEDLFDALDLTPESFALLQSAFEEVTTKQPLEIKPWSEYADLLAKRGEPMKAEAILRKALGYNPLSQQLNFVLGDLLLKQGRAPDSLEFLQNALYYDYQEQYQHDVNQYAVRARLAQAYEAVGKFADARRLYESIAQSMSPHAYPTMKEYANNRLAAIDLAGGRLPEDEGKAELLSLLKMIKQHEEASEQPTP